MISLPRRTAALAAIAFSLAAAGCSQQPNEVIAGDGGLQSEVVINEDTGDGVSPSTTQPQGDDLETTMPPIPTTVTMTTSAAPTAECAALETFLLEGLDELDDMEDEEAIAAIEATLLPAAANAGPGWERYVEHWGDDLSGWTEDEAMRWFISVTAEIDDATMSSCGVPFFGAVLAINTAASRFCVVSTTPDADDSSAFDPDECSDPVPPPSMPCFDRVEPSIEASAFASYVAIDCETGERVRLSGSGLWVPIDDQEIHTLPTTTEPAPRGEAALPSEPPTTYAPTTQPPAEFMTTTTMP